MSMYAYVSGTRKSMQGHSESHIKTHESLGNSNAYITISCLCLNK